MWLLVGALASGALARAAEPPAPPLAPLAQSALARVEAGATPAGLVLRVARAGTAAPLAVTELSVAFGTQSYRAAARADGSWLAALPAAALEPGAALDVVIAHDGVREILSGRLARAAPASTGGAARLLHDHQQLAWWVLNIAIVLIAALAISRRLS